MYFAPNTGLVNAFWLQSPTVGGNPAADDAATFGTEVDMIEYIGPGSNPAGQVNTTIHKNGYGSYEGNLTNEHTSAPTISNTGWHTIAVEWGPTYNNFYVDGVKESFAPTTTSTGGGTASGFGSGTSFISQHPEYIILDLSPGWGYVPGGSYPATLQFDYIRVYNKN